MYAVIKTGGKQYKVVPDQLLTVERLAGAAGDKVALTEVLMLADDKGLQTGTPLLTGVSVPAEIVEQKRGDKVRIFKRTRRHTYRRNAGHRQELTVLRIGAFGGAKAAKKAKPAAKSVAKKAEAEAAAPAADSEGKE